MNIEIKKERGTTMNYLLLDTETCNTIECPIAYDLGWAILNEDYEVIEKKSFVIADVFLGEKELMETAYFADKIPSYWEDIKSGTRKLMKFFNVKRQFLKDCRDYNISIVIAHNMRFDWRSLTTTQRLLTSSKYRFFYPRKIEFWDTLKMAREVFAHDEDYKNFCYENDFITKNNQVRLTAEILYRYLTKDLTFEESHTGLEDVLIEKEIFKACMERGVVNKKLWGD